MRHWITNTSRRGFSCQAQVRCQAQQLAQDSWCCHEPRRPSSRWCTYSQNLCDGDRRADNGHRVTINILVRLLPSPDTPPRVKRPVLLPPEGRVSSVVPRRQRSKVVAGFMVSLGWCLLACLHLLKVLPRADGW
jgi:hypothetical protein